MYIFTKFVTEHIFLQNRDKINVKNSQNWQECLQIGITKWAVTMGWGGALLFVGAGGLSFGLCGASGLKLESN
jgi:hypothetical protein